MRDSPESSPNLPFVPTRTLPQELHDQHVSESDPQSSRELNPYLTDYETTTHAEYEEYPTSLSGSQDLYSTPRPLIQAQTSHPEEQPVYGRTSPPLAVIYSPPSTSSNPKTSPPGFSNQAAYDNPFSTTPLQPQSQLPGNPSNTSHSSRRIQSTPQPGRSFDNGESSYAPRTNYGQFSNTYIHPPLPHSVTTFPPSRSNQTHSRNQKPSEHPSSLQALAWASSLESASTSEPLERYVTSDMEGSWFPTAQNNLETHKRRISEADETVDGFRHNKMMSEMDEMNKMEQSSEAPAEGSHWRRPTKKRRKGKGVAHD